MSATLTAVTTPVPNFLVRRSESRLERMVPPEMIMVTTPAKEAGTPNCGWITGHAEPSRESGSPRLINAR